MKGNEQWQAITPGDLKDNPFSLIGSDWMLITAGTPEKCNTMTASWGGLGVLWGKNVSFCFVRPSRHTYLFMEKSDVYTLSFFPESCRNALKYCGAHSGRDMPDKIAAAGLTVSPADSFKDFGTEGIVLFEEARLILVCRKLYFQDIQPDHFLDAGIMKNYPRPDYHRMYVGEITHCLTR